MTGKTNLSELTVDEFKTLGKEMVQDVATNHFMEAANDLYWKNTKQVGVELTGLDITKVKDVRVMRKTFDASLQCRIDKEKVSEARSIEWAKISPGWIIATAMLAIHIWVNFFKG